MPHPTDIHVGKKVKEARVLKKMSQEALSHQIGISFQQVQKYEKGSNRIGSSRLWEISKAVGQPVSFFFDGLDGEESNPNPLPASAIRLAHKIASLPSSARRSLLSFLNEISPNSNIREE